MTACVVVVGFATVIGCVCVGESSQMFEIKAREGFDLKLYFKFNQKDVVKFSINHFWQIFPQFFDVCYE